MAEPGEHTEHEDHGWTIDIPNHPPRRDSEEYKHSRAMMNKLARTVEGFYYGPPPYEDHHGGGLWLKDADGWFLVKNLAGIEWSSQFAASPEKVDALRVNARRVYAGFPEAVAELGIRELLDTPITDAEGVARWCDSICNASVPLRRGLHQGVLPNGGGIHHYPTPITDISTFCRDDFQLWVTDDTGRQHAVVPVAPRGSGDGRVRVVWSVMDTPMRMGVAAGDSDVLEADHPLARQAFARQEEPDA